MNTTEEGVALTFSYTALLRPSARRRQNTCRRGVLLPLAAPSPRCSFTANVMAARSLASRLTRHRHQAPGSAAARWGQASRRLETAAAAAALSSPVSLARSSSARVCMSAARLLRGIRCARFATDSFSARRRCHTRLLATVGSTGGRAHGSGCVHLTLHPLRHIALRAAQQQLDTPPQQGAPPHPSAPASPAREGRGVNTVSRRNSSRG